MFEGTDDEWGEYIRTVLPTAEDEAALPAMFEQEWIENKPMSPRQTASGIGASA